MAREQWKMAPDCDGMYEVSNRGGVRRVGGVLRGRWKKPVTPRRLATCLSDGYPLVRFWIHGKTKHWRINRLVLTTFVGAARVGMVAAHLNGDKTDNRVENLMWATHAENNGPHKRAQKRAAIGVRNGQHKLTDEGVRMIRHLSRTFSRRSLGRVFHISDPCIRRILRGEAWKHVS